MEAEIIAKAGSITKEQYEDEESEDSNEPYEYLDIKVETILEEGDVALSLASNTWAHCTRTSADLGTDGELQDTAEQPFKYISYGGLQESAVCMVCNNKGGSSCWACFDTFRKRNKLSVAKITEKVFECGECGKEFKYKCHLKIHLRTHTGERPYTCSYCARGFIAMSNLTSHVRTHTGERPYKCYMCEKCFAKRYTLVQHMRTHRRNAM